MIIPPARTPFERELEKLQKTVTEGERARVRLEKAAFEAWTEHGMTQAEVRGRLNRADLLAGGSGIPMNRVQKMLWRLRKRDEASA